ncbi:ribosomal protein L5 domain-containing protein [Podospora conica]|nr:ribosomal protein L5 domain-containing protein [Schizothecium conicum]
MAGVRGVSRTACGLPLFQISRPGYPTCARRSASSAAETPSSALADLETDSTLGTPQLSREEKLAFRPWKRAADRRIPLPGSRYKYHPPKFARGPLHPIQSPATSDPIARDFVPGPYHMPRLRQTWQSTVSSDLMTLAYLHIPPGTEKHVRAERLRSWDDSSPYHLNRPKRGPRGAPVLPLIERDITFRNIPELKEISIACYVPRAVKDPDLLVVARSALMAISGALPEITTTKKSVVQWEVVKGKKAGVKITIYGNEAYDFLDRCIHLVFPRIKDWQGFKATTGDGSGNLAFGLNRDALALFPEIEVNYDMYPLKSIPGCRVFIKTTATSDRQGRLLLQAMGIPFYGQIRD